MKASNITHRVKCETYSTVNPSLCTRRVNLADMRETTCWCSVRGCSEWKCATITTPECAPETDSPGGIITQAGSLRVSKTCASSWIDVGAADRARHLSSDIVFAYEDCVCKTQSANITHGCRSWECVKYETDALHTAPPILKRVIEHSTCEDTEPGPCRKITSRTQTAEYVAAKTSTCNNAQCSEFTLIDVRVSIDRRGKAEWSGLIIAAHICWIYVTRTICGVCYEDATVRNRILVYMHLRRREFNFLY